MDKQVNPCDNFYEYACGRWINQIRETLQMSEYFYDRFNETKNKNSKDLIKLLTDTIGKNDKVKPLQKAMNYYESCINTTQIETRGDKPFRNLLAKIGTWSVIDENFNKSKWNPLPIIAAIHKSFSNSILFKCTVSPDIKNASINTLTFEQAGLGLNNRDHYSNKATTKRYLVMMKKIMTLLGASHNGSSLMDGVFTFERQLAKKQLSGRKHENLAKVYQSMSLKEFSNKTEIPISWFLEFLNPVLGDLGYKITENERIVSFSTKYVRDAYKLFNQQPPEIQSAYLLWHVILKVMDTLGEKYQEIINKFNVPLNGIKHLRYGKREARAKTCLANTIKVFGFAIARPFVEKYYDKAAKNTSVEIIQSIKEMYGSNLTAMSWMDVETKKYARRKASLMLSNIGYPDFIMNDTALEEKYKLIRIEKGKYFENHIAKLKFLLQQNYQGLGKPVNKSQWFNNPTQVEAFYSLTQNKIVVTAGILQRPFYDHRAPRAWSYGGIGSIAGREIFHGFDNRGTRYSAHGNSKNWSTWHSKEEFSLKQHCFIHQYDMFKDDKYQVDGLTTLDENVADTIGLQQSFKAYQLWTKKHGTERKLPWLELTPDQLFFLSFSQMHCSLSTGPEVMKEMELDAYAAHKYRVIGTLQNSPEFSKAYNCSVGSYMNPVKKCRI